MHAAYWKYVARRRLLGEKRGSFPLEGSNWFARPLDLSEKAWKADLALLDQEHSKLREAVAGLKPGSLHFRPSTSKVSNLALICGVANHDVYHAGQIQLLKRLQDVAGNREAGVAAALPAFLDTPLSGPYTPLPIGSCPK